MRFWVRLRVRIQGTRSVHWTEQMVLRVLHYRFEGSQIHYLRKNVELRRMH